MFTINNHMVQEELKINQKSLNKRIQKAGLVFFWVTPFLIEYEH